MYNQVTTRKLVASDLDDIVDIDERTEGERRQAFWEGKVIIQEGSRPPWTAWVAEYDGSVVGFLFGHYEELEFGLPGGTVWIDILGVDPGYRHKKVGSAMIESFIEAAEDMGMKRVFTLIRREQQPDLEQFFRRQGLEPDKMMHFGKEL